MAAVYAVTKDKRLDSLMDHAIAVIAKCQRADGYIHTPVMIEEKKHPGKTTAFEDRLNFETYNMGHLMTAACVHFRATGKTSFLSIAIKAADYLAAFYHRSSPELARNAICPSIIWASSSSTGPQKTQPTSSSQKISSTSADWSATAPTTTRTGSPSVTSIQQWDMP